MQPDELQPSQYNVQTGYMEDSLSYMAKRALMQLQHGAPILQNAHGLSRGGLLADKTDQIPAVTKVQMIWLLLLQQASGQFSLQASILMRSHIFKRHFMRHVDCS